MKMTSFFHQKYPKKLIANFFLANFVIFIAKISTRLKKLKQHPYKLLSKNNFSQEKFLLRKGRNKINLTFELY